MQWTFNRILTAITLVGPIFVFIIFNYIVCFTNRKKYYIF